MPSKDVLQERLEVRFSRDGSRLFELAQEPQITTDEERKSEDDIDLSPL